MRKILLLFTFTFTFLCTAKSQVYFVVKDTCDYYVTENVSKKVASPIKVVGIEDRIVILGNPDGVEKTWKTLSCKDEPDTNGSSCTYWEIGEYGRAKCLSIYFEHEWVVYREWITKDVTGDTYFFYIDMDATRNANRNTFK